MKRKLTFVLAMILLVTLCATIFVGCDEIIKKNDTRDATQVVATVNYGSRSANIYKYELQASFNNYAYYYTYYYSMSYEEAADYVLKSLAQQKLLVLYATEKVAAAKSVPVPDDISTLLNPAEIDHAIQEVNDTLLESLKSIVESAITEDNYNNAEEEEEEDNTVADDAKTIYVKFNSQGGSSVEKQQIKVGQRASEPTDPTYDGYSFYGWFENIECTGKAIDFSERKFENTTTLFAKWVEYVEPRTVKAEEEEEDDYDPENPDITMEFLHDKFFSEAYQSTLFDEFVDEDFVEDMMIAEGENADDVLKEYISDGVATLKKNMTTNLYKDNYNDCYDYYLKSQYETIIVEKFKREIIEKDLEVSEDEVNKEFARLVKSNKETFGGSQTNYETALKDALATTYYHEFTVDANESGYGFVQNILLKLGEDEVAQLQDMLTANPANKKAVEIERNRLISKMTVKISNPSYYNNDSKKDIEKEYEDIEIIDPMTDPNFAYNCINEDGSKLENDGDKTIGGDYKAKNTGKEWANGNNYNELLTVIISDDGEVRFDYGAVEAATMPYLINEWPVFSIDKKVGIIEQIQKSFKAITDAVADDKLNEIEGLYWLRQVATEWLYMVGDDSGSLSTDSNNNGLGYLITPDGNDTSYLSDFTDYARGLIKEGSGSYNTRDLVDADYAGVDEYGEFAGNKAGYVVADSFIESGSTSSGYAGVFVLLCSDKVWDGTFYEKYSPKTFTQDIEDSKTLPLDYVMTFDKKDSKTIYDVVEESLLSSKKSDAYDSDVNTMILQNQNAYTYYKSVYKSLWKDLD